MIGPRNCSRKNIRTRNENTLLRSHRLDPVADAVRDLSDRGYDDAGLRVGKIGASKSTRPPAACCLPYRAVLDCAGSAHSKCSWHNHMVEPAMTLAAPVASRPHASCAWSGSGLGLVVRIRVGVSGQGQGQG